jgi:DNA repair exonuclease SbcCD ATPase subunit
MELTVQDYKMILFVSSTLLALFLVLWVVWFMAAHQGRKSLSAQVRDRRSSVLRPVTASSPAMSERDIRALTAAVNDLIEELNSTMEGIMSRAEQKERRLKQLVSQAENKIKSLEAHLEALKDGGVPSVMREDPASTVKKAEVSLQETDQDKSMHKILTGKYRQIFDLYDQGMTIDDISRRLSMEKGEVQLVFNLRRKL